MNSYTEHYYNLKRLQRPKGSTHARMVTDEGKKAFTTIRDFDVFQGVSGKVTFLKEKRGGKYEELGKMYFDGVWPIREKEEK
jgi:hypothetical protein|tara:strand:- start:223 stop:468 length:246 start_codon:yes stop_codon:yes gene_type:complete